MAKLKPKKTKTKPKTKPKTGSTRIRSERFQWRDDEPSGITITRKEEIPPTAEE